MIDVADEEALNLVFASYDLISTLFDVLMVKIP